MGMNLNRKIPICIPLGITRTSGDEIWQLTFHKFILHVLSTLWVDSIKSNYTHIYKIGSLHSQGTLFIFKISNKHRLHAVLKI